MRTRTRANSPVRLKFFARVSLDRILYTYVWHEWKCHVFFLHVACCMLHVAFYYFFCKKEKKNDGKFLVCVFVSLCSQPTSRRFRIMDSQAPRATQALLRILDLFSTHAAPPAVLLRNFILEIPRPAIPALVVPRPPVFIKLAP
jgi:hypothetical protein